MAQSNLESKSNFAEIRRVRHEMSQQAGHDVRRLAELLAPVRERCRDRLVDHGAKAEQNNFQSTTDTTSLK